MTRIVSSRSGKVVFRVFSRFEIFDFSCLTHLCFNMSRGSDFDACFENPFFADLFQLKQVRLIVYALQQGTFRML